MAAYLELQGIVKRFGEVVAVDHVDLRIGQGELFALLGSSGCGKSTLLRMLAGLDMPSAGSIMLDGADITGLAPYERPINMMFQSYALFPHMSVAKNIAFGLKQESMPPDRIRERVSQMLDLVQLGPLADRMPHQLSGGQQQRVALARSLAKHPKVLLLDEPLGALDKKIRQQTRAELVAVLRQVGVTCIIVTHDQEEAMSMADRLAIMTQGRIVQVGTPHEVYERPVSCFTADFVGDTNLFAGTVASNSDQGSLVFAPDVASWIRVGHKLDHPAGEGVWISVRPERVEFKSDAEDGDLNKWPGIVRDVAYLGGSSLYEVELLSRRRVKAVVPASRWRSAAAPAAGQSVHVGWSPDACTVLAT